MRLPSDPLLRAWAWLMALSLGSTLIAVQVGSGQLQGLMLSASGAAILALAWLKARIILARYLGLAQAPFWHRGFATVMALYCAGLLALYLIG